MHEYLETRRVRRINTGNALAARRSPSLPSLVRGALMSVLPKPLFLLRTSWQTARMARRLQRGHTAIAAQQQTFKRLLEKISGTVYGRDLGMHAGMSYADFKARVPIRDYQQLTPYFDRIKRGEPHVLWPGECPWQTHSAGTTNHPRWLPVTTDLLVHFEAAETAALMYHSIRVGHAGVFRGRHLSLERNPDLSPLATTKTGLTSPPLPIPATVPQMPRWGAPQLSEPGALISEMTDWPAKLDAISERTLRMDITLLSGLPHWLLVFVNALRQRALAEELPVATLDAIWPNLECLMHHGVPIGPFHHELRRAAGTSVIFHEVYTAAEAFIAAQDVEAGSGLRLIEDAGVFFEFLPLDDYHEALPLSLGAKALSLEEVRPDQDYVLLLTTPAGLCRYAVGDIVRFLSTEPPRLIMVGDTKLRLNAFAENVVEKDVTDAVVAVCDRHDWTITNFHVAPLFSSSLIGQTRGRHEWWVELKAGTTETPTGPILAAEIDVELQERHASYALKRQRGPLEAPVVRLVMPGFFAHWLQQQGRWGGPHKMPRCGSDRAVAAEFSAIACFNAD